MPKRSHKDDDDVHIEHSYIIYKHPSNKLYFENNDFPPYEYRDILQTKCTVGKNEFDLVKDSRQREIWFLKNSMGHFTMIHKNTKSQPQSQFIHKPKPKQTKVYIVDI